jgi:hypothetical protein
MYWYWEYIKPTYTLLTAVYSLLGQVARDLTTLNNYLTKRPYRVYFQFVIGEQRSTPVGNSVLAKFRKGPTVMRGRLKIGQFLVLIPKYQDKAGNPATPDGVPVWGSDNSDVLKLTVGTLGDVNDPKSFVEDANGLHCKVSPVGPLTRFDAPVMVTVAADADLGDGVQLILGTAEIDVVAGNIARIELETTKAVDEPENAPAPTTPAGGGSGDGTNGGGASS